MGIYSVVALFHLFCFQKSPVLHFHPHCFPFWYRKKWAMILDKLWMKLIFFFFFLTITTTNTLPPVFPIRPKNKLPFQHYKLIIFCMQAFVFDWFDVRIMLTFSIPSADWNGLFVPLDFLSHTQLHLSCKSIPAASRSGEEKRAVGHQWSSSQRTSGEAVP